MADAREQVLVSWSGGKDCCMALHALRTAREVDVVGLLTTVRQEDARVRMHGVSCDLIEQQAEALGLPLTIAKVPAGASNLVYEQALATALVPMVAADVSAVAFGDLFLEDIRAYREQLMQRLGYTPIFPVWARDTRTFVEEFISLGFQAIVVAIDLAVLNPSFAGRLIDSRFVADLPDSVDPCGERGEFHSFVFDGPGFRWPVDLAIGGRFVEDGLCLRTISRPAS